MKLLEVALTEATDGLSLNQASVAVLPLPPDVDTQIFQGSTSVTFFLL
jgi:hypothetical protein